MQPAATDRACNELLKLNKFSIRFVLSNSILSNFLWDPGEITILVELSPGSKEVTVQCQKILYFILE